MVEPNKVDTFVVPPFNVDILIFCVLIVQLVRVESVNVLVCNVENRMDPLCMVELFMTFDVIVLPDRVEQFIVDMDNVENVIVDSVIVLP